MKAGAVDFIEKPFSDQLLLDHIHRCIGQDAALRAERERDQVIIGRREQLSPRQRRVMDLVAAGLSNRIM